VEALGRGVGEDTSTSIVESGFLFGAGGRERDVSREAEPLSGIVERKGSSREYSEAVSARINSSASGSARTEVRMSNPPASPGGLGMSESDASRTSGAVNLGCPLLETDAEVV
jgi:hypothetical protein